MERLCDLLFELSSMITKKKNRAQGESLVRYIKEHHLVSYFSMALLWVWFWWAQMILGIWPNQLILIPSSLGGISPILSMWIIDKISGSNNLNTILQSAKNWRQNIPRLITAAFVFPLLNLLSKIIASLLGAQVTFLESGPDSLGYALILIMPLSFFTGLVSSPLFEEPGWRGFALPQLKERFGLSLASLILGSYWWLWHQGMNLAFGIEPYASWLSHNAGAVIHHRFTVPILNEHICGDVRPPVTLYPIHVPI
jgi:CAAX protease family protein